MDDESLGGVLDVIDTESGPLHQKVAPVKEEVKSEPKEVKTPEVKETKSEDKKETAPAEEDEDVKDSQDFTRTSDDESDTDVEDSSSEPSQTQETETADEDAGKSEDDLAPKFTPEPKFELRQPEFDENGYISNMTPQEYQQYLIQSAVHTMRVEAWAQQNETKALEAAEKILPEMVKNDAVRKMVESARVASIIQGTQINSYEAAKLVKEALGLSTKTVATKVAQAKAEGAQSAKTSIKIQKTAAVETQGSTKKKSESPKDAHLAKRLKAGDDEAFAELFNQWDKDGKL